jgi:hypothetical protein
MTTLSLIHPRPVLQVNLFHYRLQGAESLVCGDEQDVLDLVQMVSEWYQQCHINKQSINGVNLLMMGVVKGAGGHQHAMRGGRHSELVLLPCHVPGEEGKEKKDW